MGSHKRSQRDRDYILAKPYVKVYMGIIWFILGFYNIYLKHKQKMQQQKTSIFWPRFTPQRAVSAVGLGK